MKYSTNERKVFTQRHGLRPGLGAGQGPGGLEPLRGCPGDAGGPRPQAPGPAPSQPPVHLWAPGWRVPGGGWLLGDGCQVTTVVFKAEGSDQLVGQVRGTGGPTVGVLAGREGRLPSLRAPTAPGALPRSRKETRERRQGSPPCGVSVSQSHRVRGTNPQAGPRRECSRGWQPLRPAAELSPRTKPHAWDPTSLRPAQPPPGGASPGTMSAPPGHPVVPSVHFRGRRVAGH